jgi:hypothetical protein
MEHKKLLYGLSERSAVERFQAGESLIGRLLKGQAMAFPWPTIIDSIQGVMTTLFATEPLTGDA